MCSLGQGHLRYQNLPKIPSCLSSFAGALGARAELPREWGAAQAVLLRPCSHPIVRPHLYFYYFAQGPEASRFIFEGSAPSPFCRTITMVTIVTVSLPWLHTNCRGCVALPTAEAVAHLRVRAIISPAQALRHLMLGKWDLTPPSPARPQADAQLLAPASPLPSTRALPRARGDEVRVSRSRGGGSWKGLPRVLCGAP